MNTPIAEIFIHCGSAIPKTTLMVLTTTCTANTNPRFEVIEKEKPNGTPRQFWKSLPRYQRRH